MIVDTNCTTCGTPLPTTALAGMCPTCVKRVALAEPSLTDDTIRRSHLSRRNAAWTPPSVEEVAALLPRGFYSVESFIGRGGMGAVYKGTQLILKRPVAIKIMRQDQAADADFRLRFLREAQMLARLSHPGIVNVIDCGEAGPEFLFIVMEFVDGANLMDVIRSGGVSEGRALKITKQVCEALQFAHAHGIVHRDIKPSNIMLTRDGRIKLADFGLAIPLEPEDGAELEAAPGVGTPSYAAPEQLTAGRSVDQRADIYALGVMTYQMLTGELPRGDWKPASQTVAIDPAWDKIIEKALQPLPQNRLGAADAMQDLLSHIFPLSGDHIRRRRLRPILLAALLVALAVIAWVVLGDSKRDRNYPRPKAWADATPELRATAERYRFGQMQGQWLEIKEDAHFDLADSREFSDVAIRVTYSGWVSLGLRGTMDEYYVGLVRPDGDAKIGLGTTNVVEHPDVKPATFSLGKSYDPTQEHELVFAAQGDTMRLWLDGHEVLAFKDTILNQGRLYLRVNVSSKPELLARILRLEYAALGSAPQPAPLPRPEFKPEPGSIADVLTSPDLKWTAPVNLGPGVNADGAESGPHLSPDSLILTFASKRNNMRRFYECIRSSPDATFGGPRMISEIATWSYTPWITADRRTMVYMNPGGPGNMGSSQDIYMRQRADEKLPWGPPVNLETVNHLGHDQSPCLSSDGLTLYFGSLRGGGYGGHDMWKATRKSLDAPFGEITNLGPTINTYIQERDMHLCSDDRTLLFVRQHNEETVSTSVLHMAVPDGRGGYHVQPLAVPFQGMMTDPCLSHDGRTLLFAWKGPSGSGDLDIWQMRRVPKNEQVTTPQPALATVETPFANTLGMRFVPVPIKGGHTDKQRVLFSVWETRVQDYEVFVKETGRAWSPPPFEQGPTHPAVNLSWDDAQAFCRWLTARERKTGTISANESYRLPLDREWSCAAGIGDLEPPTASPEGKHGGLPDVFLWGREWPPPADAGNFTSEECLPQPAATAANIPVVIKGRRDPFLHTAPVGSFKPGPFGLLDLAGNVREWCEEWHDAARREIRETRGGDFAGNDGEQAMSAARLPLPPKNQTSFTGVRIVLAPESEPNVQDSVTVPPLPPPSEWTDLLPLVDPSRDSLRGSWEKKAVGLVCTKPSPWALCSIPLEEPPGDYDLRFRVTRGEGEHLAMFFLFRQNGTGGYVPVDFIDQSKPAFADGQRGAGLENTGTPMSTKGGLMARRPEWLPKGKTTTVMLQVRQKMVRLLVDGEEAFRQPVDGTKMKQEGGVGAGLFDAQGKPPIFGVGVFNCAATFHRIEMREVIATESAPGPAWAASGDPPPPEPAEPRKWIDVTDTVRSQVLADGRGTASGEWLHIEKPGENALAESQSFGDVALRATYKGRLFLVLRRVFPRHYLVNLSGQHVSLSNWSSDAGKMPAFARQRVSLGNDYDPKQEHTATFVVRGSRLALWIDGRLVATQFDDTLPTGSMAIQLYTPNEAVEPLWIRKVEYGVLDK